MRGPGCRWPLHRLRLAGELTEIGPDELAFTDDEVADLLTAHGAPLPAGCGTPAADPYRRLAGGAAVRRAGVAGAGPTRSAGWGGSAVTSRTIAGYLREEVSAAVDPADRDLLRRTAVAETVCADLADALTGRADAGQALADLAEVGGLLRRDDSRPPWYRCHPLLADLLRAELARLPADELRELHRAGGRLVRRGRAPGRRRCGTRSLPAGGTWPATCSSRTGRS